MSGSEVGLETSNAHGGLPLVLGFPWKGRKCWPREEGSLEAEGFPAAWVWIRRSDPEAALPPEDESSLRLTPFVVRMGSLEGEGPPLVQSFAPWKALEVSGVALQPAGRHLRGSVFVLARTRRGVLRFGLAALLRWSPRVQPFSRAPAARSRLRTETFGLG